MEGIDVEPVSAWITAAVPGSRPPFRFELIAGGRSNLTYRVTGADGANYVLRRPPGGHVLPTAHDMAREHRILRALAPTPVPVPQPLGLCEDVAVNGSPFYLMELVEGHVVRDGAEASALLGPAARHHAGRSMAETLAVLHAVDIDAVGLGDLAKRGDYLARQLHRWHTQFTQSRAGGEDPPAVVDRVHDRLVERIPSQHGAAVVHGDFRLDNVVLDDDGVVRAVLDWELCTLGDPLADLGLLMVYWAEPGEPAALDGAGATAAPGFLTRAEVRDEYALLTGRDVSQLDYYEAFACWKLACIVQGVYARYIGGAPAGDRSSVEAFAGTVVALAERAQATLDRLAG